MAACTAALSRLLRAFFALGPLRAALRHCLLPLRGTGGTAPHRARAAAAPQRRNALPGMLFWRGACCCLHCASLFWLARRDVCHVCRDRHHYWHAAACFSAGDVLGSMEATALWTALLFRVA